MSIDYDRMRDYVVMMGEVVDIPIDSGYILIVEGLKEVLEVMLADYAYILNKAGLTEVLEETLAY